MKKKQKLNIVMPEDPVKNVRIENFFKEKYLLWESFEIYFIQTVGI